MPDEPLCCCPTRFLLVYYEPFYKLFIPAVIGECWSL
jgi:hypothetical protein